jgi:8-oxo-dGTP diphosphatase
MSVNPAPLDEITLRVQGQRDQVDKFSTGLAVLRENQLLIVRRVAHDTLGGYYELPGGGVDPGESILDGAARELREETGLTIATIARQFPGFDYSDSSGRHIRQINLAVTTTHHKVVLNPGEHDAYAWVGSADLGGYRFTPETRAAIEGLLHQ